jgi:hypothetical protein
VVVSGARMRMSMIMAAPVELPYNVERVECVETAVEEGEAEINARLQRDHGMTLDGESVARGGYGSLYLTTSDDWFVKVTTDESEAFAVQQIMSDPELRDHPGVVRFGDIWELAQDEGEEFRVFVIVVERLDALESDPFSQKIQDRLVDLSLEAAEAYNEALAYGADQAVVDHWVKEIQGHLQAMRRNSKLRNIADFIEVFYPKVFAPADVRWQNMGRRRVGGRLVLFDVGGSKFMDELAFIPNPDEYGQRTDPETTEETNFWLDPYGNLFVSDYYDHDATIEHMVEEGVLSPGEADDLSDWIRISSNYPGERSVALYWTEVDDKAQVTQRQLDALFDLARFTPYEDYGKSLMDQVNILARDVSRLKNPEEEQLGDVADPETTELTNFWLAPDGTLYASDFYHHDPTMARLIHQGLAPETSGFSLHPREWIRVTTKNPVVGGTLRWWHDEGFDRLTQRQLDALFDLARFSPHAAWGQWLMGEVNMLAGSHYVQNPENGTMLVLFDYRDFGELAGDLDRVYQIGTDPETVAREIEWSYDTVTGPGDLYEAVEEAAYAQGIEVDDVVGLRVHDTALHPGGLMGTEYAYAVEATVVSWEGEENPLKPGAYKTETDRRVGRTDVPEDAYYGVHLTDDELMALRYAAAKATGGNVPVILTVETQGLEALPDVDAPVAQESYGDRVEDALTSLEDEIRDAIESGDRWATGDLVEEAFAVEWPEEAPQLEGGASWDDAVADTMEARQGERIAYALMNVASDDLDAFSDLFETAVAGNPLPLEFWARAINQWKFDNEIGPDRLLAVSITPSVYAELWDEDEQGPKPAEIDGQVVFSFQEAEEGDWAPEISEVWSAGLEGSRPMYHGTDWSRAAAAFPEVFGRLARTS